MLDSIPSITPGYSNAALSNYRYFDEVGANEEADPHYFAPSLITKIAETP